MNRRQAMRELALRALTRPSSLLPPAAMVAAGVILNVWPLYPAAAAVYAALAGTAMFSVDEAKKVIADQRGGSAPEQIGPEITDPVVAAEVERAAEAERGIREALAAAPVDLPEVRAELSGLMSDVRRLAVPAQSIRSYLASVDEDALRAERDRVIARLSDAEGETAASLEQALGSIEQQLGTAAEMRAKLDRFDARMTELVASLGAIRAQVARLSLGDGGEDSARILAHVTSARDYVGELAGRITAPG